jgi:hypothetical protein
MIRSFAVAVDEIGDCIDGLGLDAKVTVSRFGLAGG